MRIFIRNLPVTTKMELRKLVSPFGEIGKVRLPVNRETGQPRGFAFITMGRADQAYDAIGALDGRPWHGRNLQVCEAEPRPAGRELVGKEG